jgi:hypothetical protein
MLVTNPKHLQSQGLLNLFYWQSSSGESVLIQGVECGLAKVPLHHVNLPSDLASGPVTVGVRSVLPVDGVHLLLGNALAGDKVVVNPIGSPFTHENTIMDIKTDGYT